MKIINGDKLIHTDNAGDVIEHFGTKGMKWGVRKAARAAVNVGKNLCKLLYTPISNNSCTK